MKLLTSSQFTTNRRLLLLCSDLSTYGTEDPDLRTIVVLEEEIMLFSLRILRSGTEPALTADGAPIGQENAYSLHNKDEFSPRKRFSATCRPAWQVLMQPLQSPFAALTPSPFKSTYSLSARPELRQGGALQCIDTLIQPCPLVDAHLEGRLKISQPERSHPWPHRNGDVCHGLADRVSRQRPQPTTDRVGHS
ncbi:unnamed protein product [Protopolystoma xenopodis]|uniref:Uncharacterized protein n=1 Tax=Protopolystoma xenopodis TaxID=117903 RepID=A0A448XN69_9PLAT|nr:unnamed protein product [Protopolystoma xenopodis]